MTATRVPPGAVLVDTDVVSWLALGEGRADEFGKLLVGHELFISFVTAAEIRTFLAMNVLSEDGQAALAAALNDYTVLDVNLAEVISEWAKLRSATARSTTPDDRERRQNDTWIAACALSQPVPLPVVTGNLRDFQVLADASQLTLIHPDL
jgi:predicted nucleic acid-binding protein